MSESRDFKVLVLGATRNHNHGFYLGEGVTWESPDHQLLAAEEAEERERTAAAEEAAFFERRDRMDERVAHFKRILRFTFLTGPDPRAMLQRVAAVQIVVCTKSPAIAAGELERLLGTDSRSVDWRRAKVYGTRPSGHIDKFLRAIHQRLALRGRERTWASPDLAMLADKHAGLLEQTRAVFEGTLADPTSAEDCQRVLRFLLGDGPRDWRAVVQRLFAVAQVLCPGATGYMSKSDVGQMLAERKASPSWRAKQIFRGLGLFVPGNRGVETQGKNAARVRERHRRRKAHHQRKTLHHD